MELIVLLGTLQAFAPMSVDMYLASLPRLEQVFGVSAAEVQRTLAAFFFGFAGGQSFYGPLADRFGRKPPLYFSILLFITASAGCALAPSIEWLAVFRFFQAVGACGGAVISRAMVRDLFAPAETRRVFSTLMLVNGVAPVAAPLIGGYLLLWFGWQSIFWTLGLTGTVTLAGVHFHLRETLDPSRARPLEPGRVFATYGALLADRTLLGASLAVGAAGAGMFAYIASSPFVFINLYGVAPERFGWIFGTIAIGIVVASQVNGRLMGGVPALRVLRWSSLAQCSAGVLLLAAVETGWGGAATVYLPLLVYVSLIGMVFPNGSALALARHAEVAGMASALLGTVQFSAAALSTTLLGLIGEGSARPMALVVLACGAAAVAVNFGLLRGREGEV
jgi:DHA1 family bicyclomycin/chloramphenicol resistance-like MFS transporter